MDFSGLDISGIVAGTKTFKRMALFDDSFGIKPSYAAIVPLEWDYTANAGGITISID